MEREIKIIVPLALILLFSSLAFILYLAPNSQDKDNNDKIVVAASLMPQKEFIEAVGKERVQVVIMVPEGADPHTYEIKPHTMEEVSKAELYFQIGSGIEFEMNYMDKIKSINPQIKVVNSSRELKFIPQNHEGLTGEGDPHVWTSPDNVKAMVNVIYEELIKIDPKYKDFYQENKEEYISEVDYLDQKIKEETRLLKNRKILVYHPAWAYLCRDYGLEQVAIEKDGKEPTPQSMARIIRQAKKDQIKVIFVSPQFSRKNADFIAQEIGAEVIIIDPLAPDYLKNMKKLVEALKKTQ